MKTHQRFCLRMKICNKIVKIIQLLKIQNNYLFRAGKTTKSVFNFLHQNSTTFQFPLKFKKKETRKCEFVSQSTVLGINSIVPFKVTQDTLGLYKAPGSLRLGE